MTIEWETAVILVLIAIVLVPTWAFALASASPSHEVVLNGSSTAIAPTETFLPTPAQVDEYVAGVIVWVALLVLVAMIFYTHQFIRTVGRAAGASETAPTTTGQSAQPSSPDGGTTAESTSPGPLPSYLRTPYRRVLEYWPARYSTPGMVSLTLFAWASVTFAALFGLEAMTWSRRQYLGIYAGMLFLSLGVLVAIYATWFVPDVVVAESVHPDQDTHDRSPEDTND
ncbi:MAG: hypothetical protein ABEI77_08835 [Halorientalis sp.]